MIIMMTRYGCGLKFRVSKMEQHCQTCSKRREFEAAELKLASAAQQTIGKLSASSPNSSRASSRTSSAAPSPDTKKAASVSSITSPISTGNKNLLVPDNDDSSDDDSFGHSSDEKDDDEDSEFESSGPATSSNANSPLGGSSVISKTRSDMDEEIDRTMKLIANRNMPGSNKKP